jgi:5'-phosphate synthase pdxT subunit
LQIGMTRIGVLALQGAFAEHIQAFSRLGAQAIEVRLPKHLVELDGLVVPGGESTTISRLMIEYGLLSPLHEMASQGFPLWGTCAGMILLAKRVTDLTHPTLATMDVAVRRNAFGRQMDSFEADLAVSVLGPDPFRAIFIRAPILVEMGPQVQALARLDDGTTVAAREGHLLATAFHPELTADLRFHRYFLEMIAASKGEAPARRSRTATSTS